MQVGFDLGEWGVGSGEWGVGSGEAGLEMCGVYLTGLRRFASLRAAFGRLSLCGRLTGFED